MSHKAGFVNILGNPNVGKSTLMNALVGEKLAITTSKAQTTRHRLMGIVNGEDFQIVYSDTPGIINPHYKMHEYMMKFIETALIDADIFLLVTEINDQPMNEKIIEKIKTSGLPVIVLINKIDLSDQAKAVELMNEWQQKIPDAKFNPQLFTESNQIASVANHFLSNLCLP